mmetsp:Transcript_46543/g.96110  ORF Transcript_46543/g.96110 Transcript_46543/m.96110 type:complete len:85 (-) Transcript_46543:37-291(-)
MMEMAEGWGASVGDGDAAGAGTAGAAATGSLVSTVAATGFWETTTSPEDRPLHRKENKALALAISSRQLSFMCAKGSQVESCSE